MERHTRQGRARGQSYGTLDGGELYDARKDTGSHTATNLREQMQGPRVEQLDSALRPGKHGPMHSGGGCWCGKPMGHGWWGHDEGVPHPRPEQPQ